MIMKLMLTEEKRRREGSQGTSDIQISVDKTLLYWHVKDVKDGVCVCVFECDNFLNIISCHQPQDTGLRIWLLN